MVGILNSFPSYLLAILGSYSTNYSLFCWLDYFTLAFNFCRSYSLDCHCPFLEQLYCGHYLNLLIAEFPGNPYLMLGGKGLLLCLLAKVLPSFY